MAYSISGFVSEQNGDLVPNCYYQFLFIKKDLDSDDTIWSNVYQTDSHGYYSHDLSDGDLLDTDGNFDNGDEVLIAYWLGDSTRSTSVTHYTDWIHVIDDRGKDVHVQNLILFPEGPPIAHFYDLPVDGTAGVTYDIINDSTAVITFEEIGQKFYQHCTYLTIPIFETTCIIQSEWDYSDGTSEILIGIHDGSHAWFDPGTYDITLTVTNGAGLTDSYSEQINIRHSVIVDFIYDPSIGVLGEPITFTNTTFDPGNRVGTHTNGKEYCWEFYDGDIMAAASNIYCDDYTFQPEYIFTNQPDRCVILRAYWNDGLIDRISSKTICLPFFPHAKFEKIDTGCSPIYRDSSDPGSPPVTYYWWVIEEQTPSGWRQLFTLEGSDRVQIKYHFPNIGTFKIWHKIRDSGGLEDEYEQIYLVEDCPCKVGVSEGSLGGHYLSSGPGGAERPQLIVRLKSIKEKRKKLKMMLTFVKVEEKKKKKTSTKKKSTKKTSKTSRRKK